MNHVVEPSPFSGVHVLTSIGNWLEFSRLQERFGIFIEKNRTSSDSDSFGQSECHMYSFLSTNPRLQRVCVCMCMWLNVIRNGCSTSNSEQTVILSESLSNTQHFKHMYIEMCICTYVYVCIHTYIYVHTYICVCIRMYICGYIFVDVFVYT